MDKTHYTRRSHEQGNYELTPTYTGQVVVTIKSLATGLTMKVYLDEPTLGVMEGINVTTYTGHFYEEEFMITPSEGYEITGLPLMYPYLPGDPIGITIVIDTENHSVIFQNGVDTDPVDLALVGIIAEMLDFPPSETLPESGNAVSYNFTPFGDTSDEPDVPIVVPADPVNPVHPGGGSEWVPAT